MIEYYQNNNDNPQIKISKGECKYGILGWELAA